MDHAEILRRLIERNAPDFLSYYRDTDSAALASRVIGMALAGVPFSARDRELLEWMIPDTEDDGRVEASYALNAGAMVLSLIAFRESGDEEHYNDAVTLFFDTVWFKVHEDFEAQGVDSPSEQDAAAHPFSVEARAWLASLEASA